MILVPRKASKLSLLVSVPQTDTGRRVEYTQVIEITKLKELGNTTTVTSG